MDQKEFEAQVEYAQKDPASRERSIRAWALAQLVFLDKELRDDFQAFVDKIKAKHPNALDLVRGYKKDESNDKST